MSSTFDEHPLTRATRFARSPGVGVALALLSSAASAAPTTLDAFTSVENCSPWVVDLGDALGSHGTTTGLARTTGLTRTARRLGSHWRYSLVLSFTRFDVGIQTGDGYSYDTVGNADLAKSVSLSVADGVLKIEATSLPQGPVSPIVVVVTAPSDASITSISSTGSGDMAILKGFASEKLDVTLPGSGDFDGDVDVSGLLTVGQTGSGDVTVAGSIGDLSLTAQGSGDMNFYGVDKTASVTLSGSGDVFIGGSSSLSVTGTDSGSGDLSYDGGSCDVKLSGSGDVCVRSQGRTPPSTQLPSPRGTSIYGGGAYTC